MESSTCSSISTLHTGLKPAIECSSCTDVFGIYIVFSIITLEHLAFLLVPFVSPREVSLYDLFAEDHIREGSAPTATNEAHGHQIFEVKVVPNIQMQV